MIALKSDYIILYNYVVWYVFMCYIINYYPTHGYCIWLYHTFLSNYRSK